MGSSMPTKAGAAGAVPAIADHARMLETLLSNLPGMVYRCRNDRDWTMLFVSEGSRELTGYSPAELSDSHRTSYADLIVPEDRGRVWDAVQAALEKRETFELRYRITTAAGAQKWVWERGLGVFDAAGRVEHIEGFITDITATVNAELELRASETRLALVFNASRDMMCLVKVERGPTFRVVSVNEEYVRIVQRAGFNLSAGDLIGRTFADDWPALFQFPPDALAELVGRYRRVVETKQPLHYEEHTATPTGTFTGDTWLTPVCNQVTGECEFVLFTSTDITERVRTERALRASEEKFSKAFRASPDAISVSDALTGRILDVNEGFVRTSGYPRDEIIGRTLAELGLWTSAAGRDRMMAELSASGSVHNAEIVGRMRSGKERTFLVSAERVEISGRPCFVVMSRDITEQKQGEQALRESEAKALKAFRATPDAVFITEMDTGKIVDVNESGCRLYGYARDEFVGRTTLEIGLVRPADRQRMVDALRQGGGTLRDFQLVARGKDGVDRTVLLSCETIELGGRTHLVTIAHDITDRKRVDEERAALEEQYRQAQKLEALGQLAGGIAHDFNNILTGIMAYTELTLLDADRPEEVRKHIGAVRHASQRAGDLVRQILTFSRRQAPERRPTRLSAAVREAFKLLRSTLPKTIEIVEEIDPTAPIVLADTTQIHQVVMNLCTNAAHAMKDRPGRLTVRVALFESGVTEGLAPLGVGQGRHTRLTIADTGSGMDEATLSHIFEPFFTTKAPGEGTGLGLAVVHGIVEEHDGVITVRSQPGVGTTFDLYFPEFSALEDSTPPFETPLPRGAGQRVLFVDDEGVIVRAVAQLLERLGYRPTVHGDPREAWAAFDAQPDAFDVVVTDLTMPHWTGLDLARRILARRADIPIILTTGHSGSWTLESIRGLGLRGMINKPLTSAKLANELHAMLGSPPAGRLSS